MMSQRVRVPINTGTYIRVLDPIRDMHAVLNLIEVGFRGELDPQGWKMLEQMRRVYSPGHVTRSLYASPTDTTGFVWEQDGRVVGNLSLRHASPRSARGRLIGNVVVHPEYQGQGIGRGLMERAIATARDQGASWVGLEVRADNAVAHTLYEHLGFQVAGHTEHLIRPAGLPWPDGPHPDSRWRRATSGDNVHWKRLAILTYTTDQRLILEIRNDIYEYGGLERRLNLWFNRKHEKAWVHRNGADDIDLTAHVEIEKRYRFHTWDMLMHPEAQAAAARELIARCLSGTRTYPTWPVITIVPDKGPLVESLRAIDFRRHRTLQQMILEF
jgi:GNAT superfamily N-acetyltransferase